MQTELMRVQLLDWLNDHARENPGQFASIVDFLEPDDRADEHQHLLWRGVVRDLASDGLVLDASGMGVEGLSAMITTAGHQDVEARRIRRADRAQRHAFVRNAVVRYVYANSAAPDLEPMLRSHYYEGSPLAKHDLDTALQYLLDKSLVQGMEIDQEVLIHVKLTDRGIDCVESFGGSVSEYLTNDRGSGNTTVNFHGSVSGSNVAWNSRQIAQTATTTSTGLAGDELAAIMGAIKQALPVLGFEESEATKLRGQLEVAEGELEGGEPDAGVIKSVMRRVLDKVGGVAATSLGTLLTAYAKDLMQKAGIPID